MKIDRISYTHTYQIGLSQWQKVGLEASIDDTEDPKECLAKLEQEAHNFHRKSNPQLYKNGNEALVDGYDIVSSGRFAIRDGSGGINTTDNPHVKVINRKYEEMEGIIKECETLEELAKHKEYCGKHPDLMPAYMNKLKSLT